MSSVEAIRPIALVTDSASSVMPEPEIYPESKLATIIPMGMVLFRNGEVVSCSEFDISLSDFYEEMRKAKQLPQTSQPVFGKFYETYLSLAPTNDILSIHITGKKSGTVSVAEKAAEIALADLGENGNENMVIKVVDSQKFSYATWFLVEHAAALIKAGANLGQIEEEVLNLITKVNIITYLETYENLRKGGRGKEVLMAMAVPLLRVYPLIGVKDGELKPVSFIRTPQLHKAIERMIQLVGDPEKLVKVAVLHTNSPQRAEELVEALRKIFTGEIRIRDAGPALAVHADEGAVAIAFQTK